MPDSRSYDGQTLASSDPEPPVGTFMEDRYGALWEHVRQPLASTYWVMVADFDAAPESWVKVAGNYGPVTVRGN